MPTEVTVQNLYIFNSTLSKTEEDVSRNAPFALLLFGSTYFFTFLANNGWRKGVKIVFSSF